MSRLLLLLLLAVLALGSPARSQSPHQQPAATPSNIGPQFSVEPSIRYGFGETEYILDAFGYDSLGVFHSVKSHLEFPLDGVYGGLDFAVLWNPASPKPWDSRISISTNITNPTGDMTDRDWLTDWPPDNPIYLPSAPEVSSTISAAEGRVIVLTAELGKVIAAASGANLRLFAGYRYQNISQDAIGLAGWYLDRNGNELYRVTIDSTHYDGITGIEYDVTFHTPNAGLEVFSSISPSVSLSARGAYAPVFASDRDDHVLRNLESEASINGHGFMGGANLEFLLRQGANSRTFITLTGDILYFSASGTGFQRFYDDQPGTPEDETGDFVGGVPHEINSTQGRLGIGLRMAYSSVFDGRRKGFVLGGGLGFSPFARTSLGSIDENHGAFGLNLMVGWAWDEYNMIVYEGNVAGYSVDIDFYEYRENVGVAQGFNGAAYYHYFSSMGSSAFTVGGLGFYVYDVEGAEDIKPGVGYLLGAGYQFSPCFQVGVYLSGGKTSQYGSDFGHNHLSFLVSAAAY